MPLEVDVYQQGGFVSQIEFRELRNKLQMKSAGQGVYSLVDRNVDLRRAYRTAAVEGAV